jgi:SAM-dependent methyltransferase
MDLIQHNIEIQKNLNYWKQKPVLREIYQRFYQLIAGHLIRSLHGNIVELGSGIGNIKMVIPEAICTDIFKNPWIDQVENAYQLSFAENSISNLILFDVFHHLEFPGTAFKEFFRVLKPSGRIVIFEPYISLTGLIVYGLFHHEPVGFLKKITWFAPDGFDPWKINYYASQGNASRVFFLKKYFSYLNEFEIITKKRIPALPYIFSGGYSKPQLLPDKTLSYIQQLEPLLQKIPALFATRVLIVLSKKDNK